jgi:hypothetical protein
MSVEQRLHLHRSHRAAPHTYFVGRRPFEAVELFAITAATVEPFACLDWHGNPSERLELSRLVLGRVAEQRASRELRSRFAFYVLSQLPHGGFVLDSEEILRWLHLASDPQDFAPTRPRWAGRVRSVFHGTDRSSHA